MILWLAMSGDFTGRLLIGLGAFLAGCGSVLSGIAALQAARREPKTEPAK